MTKKEQILLSIEGASQRIGTTWPLYSFVTSNPLSGYEKLPFHEAVEEAGRFLKSNTYPSASVYKQAYDNKDIDKVILSNILKEHQLMKSPEIYLKIMQRDEPVLDHNVNATKLDVIMTKWLAAFMDEGLAEWSMPNKEKGFYNAWKSLASYDKDIGKPSLKYLPGWTGYIKHRQDTNSVWQQQFPIRIEDYLAVRLTIANHLNFPLELHTENTNNEFHIKLKYLWLKAWETTFQNRLVSDLKANNIDFNSTENKKQLPDAQMVFCIDTRSEIIRRHIEASGNYETYGYAGFFGITADYQHYQENITIKSCPPIVVSSYKITEKPNSEHIKEDVNFKKGKKMSKSKVHILKRLKNMLPSSFGFVEGAGAFYGLSLIAQSFIPSSYYKIKNRKKRDYESFCEPQISYNNQDGSQKDITLEEKVAIVKSGFDLMGWDDFAPLVLFVGHGSQTANNPFGSSLDCGACAASPGRHNARLLAALANDKKVREILGTTHNFNIPKHTIFIGGEHNTTTDEIVLFDAATPDSHKKHLVALKNNLKIAQETASSERLKVTSGSVSLAKHKSLNWGETRPEWGLAKNAAFIVGSRELTSSMNLDGRCFMHSYNWKSDTEGNALGAIMGGPMVVTQWINNHYYFSTVDNNSFGGGSKITHNITGQFGVVQGNGGDLKMGLPLQSLKASDTEMYHQPLRLTTIIHAPLKRVETLLKQNKHLKTLLDNEWMYLKVIDASDSNVFKTYKNNFQWEEEHSNSINTIEKKTTQEIVKQKQKIMVKNKYKILVLSGLKEKSAHTLNYAAKLSKEIDAEVECFHVEELRTITQIENPFSVSDAIRDLYKKMNKKLKEFIKPISDENGIDIKSSFVVGNIKNEIETRILTTQPDMIILGERTPKKFRLFSDNILSIVQENFKGVIFVATDHNTLDENGKVSLNNLGLKNNISNYTVKQKEKIKV